VPCLPNGFLGTDWMTAPLMGFCALSPLSRKLTTTNADLCASDRFSDIGLGTKTARNGWEGYREWFDEGVLTLRRTVGVRCSAAQACRPRCAGSTCRPLVLLSPSCIAVGLWLFIVVGFSSARFVSAKAAEAIAQETTVRAPPAGPPVVLSICRYVQPVSPVHRLCLQVRRIQTPRWGCRAAAVLQASSRRW
jgi:hypothetical protein